MCFSLTCSYSGSVSPSRQHCETAASASASQSAKLSERKKYKLADSVNLLLNGAKCAKPQVITGIMKHAAVGVSHAFLTCCSTTDKQVAGLNGEKKETRKCAVKFATGSGHTRLHRHKLKNFPQPESKLYLSQTTPKKKDLF